MSLNKQQLLIPRVLCIGGKEGEPNYPGSKFKTGDVLLLLHYIYYKCTIGGKFIPTHTVLSETVNQFPHLFKPLPWWEMRDKSDLPKYVKNIKNGRIYKAVWDCFKFKGEKEWSLILQPNGIPITPDGFEPATEQEYWDSKPLLKCPECGSTWKRGEDQCPKCFPI